MASKSKSQQRLFGIAYAYKKGDIPEEEVSDEVKDLADSLSLKKLKDYAETKHDDLPDKVKESVSGVFKNNSKIFPFQASIIAFNWKKQGGEIIKDKENDVIFGIAKRGDSKAVWKYDREDYVLMHDLKSRELFDLTKEPKNLRQTGIPSIFEAETATLSNTPGTGSINFPGDPGTQQDFASQETGSGDVPANSEEDEEEEEEDELKIFVQAPAPTFMKFEKFKESNQ